MKIAAVILVVAFVLAILVIVVIKRRAAAGRDQQWPFYLKKPLTEPEQILYHRLVKALPECIVLAQVQLSRVLGVKKGFNFRQWNNRINRLSLDFLICQRNSTVVAAVELDDTSHDNPLRREADARKEKALRDARVTLVRWSVSALPDESTIRTALIKKELGSVKGLASP
jgi:hypothetical protein